MTATETKTTTGDDECGHQHMISTVISIERMTCEELVTLLPALDKLCEGVRAAAGDRLLALLLMVDDFTLHDVGGVNVEIEVVVEL